MLIEKKYFVLNFAENNSWRKVLSPRTCIINTSWEQHRSLQKHSVGGKKKLIVNECKKNLQTHVAFYYFYLDSSITYIFKTYKPPTMVNGRHWER